MRLRSLLFVPGDSERKFTKACATAADGLILDLEDAVAPARKESARQRVSEFLDGSMAPRAWGFWVRINPFASGLSLVDLAAVVRPGLDGIVLPKADGPSELARLGHCLDVLEVKAGIPAHAIKILVVATETPAALFNLGGYAPAHPRLAALTWGAEDLAAALGASDNKGPDGNWAATYELARSLCLVAAANAGVIPLDTLFADFRDSVGLERSCRAARRDGFLGRIAIHPDQVDIINACFTPSPEELAAAQRVVAAFAAQPDSGAVAIDGRMYDIPHLKQAQRTLASGA
jgi:citrate lyase subunit beta/citryl-CoA lyase